MPRNSIRTKKIIDASLAMCAGLVGDLALPLLTDAKWDGVFFQRHQFYHRVSLATLTTGETKFFHVAASNGVSNVVNPRTIVGGESVFLMTHLMVDVQPQYQPDGTAEADGEPYQADADPATVAADIAAILRHGTLRIRVNKNEREYQGLHNFPFGGGPFLQGNHNNTTATTLSTLAVVNNGNPDQNNRFAFSTPWPIFPDDPVEVALRWSVARALKDAFTFAVYLDGVLIDTSSS